MQRKIECEFCGCLVEATTGNQRICSGDACKKRLRSETRKRRYYAARPDPTCEWCGDPILEPRRRRYHGECRDDKNRERVRAYNRTHKPSRGPKQSRTYDGSISCMVCKTTVQKTGARQIICKNKTCINRLKQIRKKQRRDQKRMILEIKAKKEQARIKTKQPGSESKPRYRAIAV